MRVILTVLQVVVLGAWPSTTSPEVLVVAEDKHSRIGLLPNSEFEAVDAWSIRRPGSPALTGSLTTPASQEGLAAPRSFRGLVSDVAQIPDVERVRQLRIATVTAEPVAGAAAEPRMFALLEQRVVPGGLRRERFPQLSYDRLVVIVRDAAGRELDWRVVPNPSIVRAEAPGPDGRLRGEIVEVDSVELSIAIPDVAGADRVYIYRPRWTGTEYLLDPFGQVRLAPSP